MKQLIKNYSPARFNIKMLLVIVAFILCVLALSDLAAPEVNSNVKLSGIDVMIALDVSNSMLADDIKPSRLERARQVVSKLIDKLGDNRIGLVIFAGKAYLQMPLTIDHGAAKMYLSSASPGDVPTQGTVISDGLKMCYSAFNTQEAKYRSIILITDGEDHDPDAISLSKRMADEGVIINTVGIGSPQGVVLRDPQIGKTKLDENGQPVVTKLNEEELISIAKNGNGIYQLFSSSDLVSDKLVQKLSGIQQSGTGKSGLETYVHYFWVFLLVALGILSIEAIIPEIKKIRVNKALALLLCSLSFSCLINAQNTEIQKGNEAYKTNNYPAAISSYQKAVNTSPRDTIASYNLGNAQYKNNKADIAVASYDNVLSGTSYTGLKEKAYYNKGVALQKQKKLPDCIKAYEEALKIDAKDEDARQNLERALIQQKQQQSQQNQKQNQKQKQQPQPKISKQDAEEKLKSLEQREKELQDKLRKSRSAPQKLEKDW